MSETAHLLDDASSKNDLNNNGFLKLYRRRWFIALLIGIQSMIAAFFVNSIGIVNNVYAAYFDVSLVAVDWLTVIQFPGCIIAIILIALLVYTGKAGLKNLTVAVGFANILIATTFLLASRFSFLYPALFVAEFLVGACYATGFITITQLANYWFPENQVGSAFMFVPLMTGAGAILAYLIPSNVLQTPPVWDSGFQAANVTVINLTHQAENISWRRYDEKVFMILNGTALIISVAVFALSLIVVQDYPPTPATRAQLQLRQIQLQQEANMSEDSSTINDFLSECKRIMSDDVVLIVGSIASLRFSFIALQIIFFGEISRSILGKTHILNDRNGLSGVVLGSYEFAMIIGILVFGKFMDHFQIHLLSIRLSFICGFFAFIGTMLGIYFSKIAVLSCFYILVGFAIGISNVPLYDTAVQHMFPTKPGLIIALIFLVTYSGPIIISQLSRLLLKYVGELALMIFSLLIFLVAFLLSCALKPDFKRIKINSS